MNPKKSICYISLDRKLSNEAALQDIPPVAQSIADIKYTAVHLARCSDHRGVRSRPRTDSLGY